MSWPVSMRSASTAAMLTASSRCDSAATSALNTAGVGYWPSAMAISMRTSDSSFTSTSRVHSKSATAGSCSLCSAFAAAKRAWRNGLVRLFATNCASSGSPWRPSACSAAARTSGSSASWAYRRYIFTYASVPPHGALAKRIVPRRAFSRSLGSAAQRAASAGDGGAKL